MPRTVSIGETNYPARAQLYGPFSIDSFTENDADGIEAALTVVAWPTTPAVLAEITISMSNGKTKVFQVIANPKNRDGTPASVFRIRCGIPADGVFINGIPQPPVKRATSTATASVRVFATFRTAITVSAITR